MQGVKERMEALSSGMVTADDKSMYRALRRLEDIELVRSTTEKNPKGPDKKNFGLTHRGMRVLAAYISGYVQPVHMNSNVVELMEEIVDETK
ncbi:helix-turn-helix transcriptional regulator [Candidatus Saccharibacteria bacterium]|nr:helix-turn-helix transcriptional regulator [Candidatus Saccharibacteria bacterium]